MTVETSEEKISSKDKLEVAMEESAVEPENTHKEDNSEPKEDPRILGLISEVPSAEAPPIGGTITKLGPSTTLTPVNPKTSPSPATSSTTQSAEATPLTKAAETKQPKRR